MRIERTRQEDRPRTLEGCAGREKLSRALRDPQTLAEWASVCKGFRVVIKELLRELGRRDYTVKKCKRCGLIKEHSPKGRRCRDCWREFDRQREIDYKRGFMRPRPKVRGADGRYKRTYVRRKEVG